VAFHAIHHFFFAASDASGDLRIDFIVTIWHILVMHTVTFTDRRTPARRVRLALLGRLQEAESDHDRARREGLAGVTQRLLDADKARWSRIGEALAAMARLVSETCASSAFGETRPKVEDVAVRLSEAIDDQLDSEAWPVVDAATRLAASQS
jgi:hypothetical protein